MDFYVWLLRARACGASGYRLRRGHGRQPQRELLRCPIEFLSRLGVSASDVDDVVLTHLHYDHAGNLDKLPRVQDGEMDYATGRCMCHAPLRHAYEVEDVVTLVRRVYEDRVVFHDGDAELAPGLRLLKIGGHTKGLQALRVHTRRGWWCWRRTRATITRTWNASGRSPSCTTPPPCWRARQAARRGAVAGPRDSRP